MKKIVTSICMVALVALAFTSCKKKENAQVYAFNYSTEQLVNDEGSFDKMYVDGSNYTVNFENDDEFEVFYVGTDAQGGNSSTLGTYKLEGNELQPVPGTGVVPQNIPNGHYYAFYPGANVTYDNSYMTENYATFHMDATQVCKVDPNGKPMIPANALYMAAKDESSLNWNDAFFDFKNICGVLSCKFYSPSGKVVKSIKVTDRKFHLVGDVTLKVDKVDPVEMTTLFRNYSDTPEYMQALNEYKSLVGYNIGGTVSSTVMLDCSQVPGGGVQLGQTEATATRFFIVLRPLALLNGCDVVITFDDDDTYEIHSDVNNCIAPNIIKNIAAENVD